MDFKIADLKKFTLSKPKSYQYIIHPDNLKYIQSSKYEGEFGYLRLFGVELITSEACPKYEVKWEFPYHPWIEWEKSDEDWAIPLRHGRWVEDPTKPVIVRIEKPSQIPTYEFDFAREQEELEKIYSDYSRRLMDRINRDIYQAAYNPSTYIYGTF